MSMTIKERLKSSGTNVLDARAQSCYNALKAEQQRYIFNLRSEVTKYEDEIARHCDLSIKNTTSLIVGTNSDPVGWINKRHELESKLYVAKKKLGLALLVDKSDFPEEDNKVDTSKDDEYIALVSK